MDRVRVGLTGLGAVFLLTLGASLTFGAADRGSPAASVHKEPGEPLAQLGVAPGPEKSPTAKPRRPDPAPAEDRTDEEALAESPVAAVAPPILGDTAAT